SILGTRAEDLPAPSEALYTHALPDKLPRPKDLSIRTRYPVARRFRAAIPNLRFGSGVRFELVNSHENGNPRWSVEFYFGSSKDIRSVALDGTLLEQIRATELWRHRVAMSAILQKLDEQLSKSDSREMQSVWARGRDRGLHPYELVDALGATASDLQQLLSD